MPVEPKSTQALSILQRSTALLMQAVVSTTLGISIESARARAGFSPEQLAGFEITELQATVTTALPQEKVLEIIDPQGHTEILTAGIDLEPLGLSKGDLVKLAILDGLVVDLVPSKANALSFNREDIILPMDMGQLRKGMRVALASGTARVIRIDRQDRSISLMGPLGGIHNLDVLSQPGEELFPGLNTGALVDFRLIQPMAIAVEKIKQPAASVPMSGSDQLPKTLRPSASLKQELLESIEFAHLEGTISELLADGRAFSLTGPEGHALTLSAGVNLNQLGIRPGDEVSVDLLEGLIVDLRPSNSRELVIEKEEVVLSTSFGPVPKGTSVTMITGSAQVVRISKTDHSLSLKGPLGGVHNLDVRRSLETDVLPAIKVGDIVEFRIIQPIAYAVKRLGNP